MEFSMIIRGREFRRSPVMVMLRAAAQKPAVGPNHRAIPKLATELTEISADVEPNVKRTANQSLAMSIARSRTNPVTLYADTPVVDGNSRFKVIATADNAAVNAHVRATAGVMDSVGIVARRWSTFGRFLSSRFEADL